MPKKLGSKMYTALPLDLGEKKLFALIFENIKYISANSSKITPNLLFVYRQLAHHLHGCQIDLLMFNKQPVMLYVNINICVWAVGYYVTLVTS